MAMLVKDWNMRVIKSQPLYIMRDHKLGKYWNGDSSGIDLILTVLQLFEQSYALSTILNILWFLLEKSCHLQTEIQWTTQWWDNMDTFFLWNMLYSTNIHSLRANHNSLEKPVIHLNALDFRYITGILYHFMMTSSNGNIFRVTGPLCGEYSPHKGQWRGVLTFSLICAWTTGLTPANWVIKSACTRLCCFHN